VNEVLKQARELQAARPHESTARTFWGSHRPPPGEDDQQAGTVGSQATAGVAASLEGKQKTTTGAGNMTEGGRLPRDSREPARKYKWRPSNNREADRRDR
jgi:hypothetical protein